MAQRLFGIGTTAQLEFLIRAREWQLAERIEAGGCWKHGEHESRMHPDHKIGKQSEARKSKADTNYEPEHVSCHWSMCIEAPVASSHFAQQLLSHHVSKRKK